MSRYKDCGEGKALLRLFEFTLGATDGKDTADGMFEVFFGPGFSRYEIIFSGVAPEMDIAVDELIIDEDGEFSDIIKTAAEFERCRLTGSQLLAVCKNYSHRLQKEGVSNFFILTKGDEPVTENLANVFVVSVKVGQYGILLVSPRHVSNVYVWSCDDGFRLFSRKQ